MSGYKYLLLHLNRSNFRVDYTPQEISMYYKSPHIDLYDLTMMSYKLLCFLFNHHISDYAFLFLLFLLHIHLLVICK